MWPLVALGCGGSFGAGLTLSGMTDPARVLGFLDVLGNWDPTLALVMGAALAISLPAFQWMRRHPRPLLDSQYFVPEPTRIDASLLIGATLFGVGWGIAGLCPGPALASIASANPDILLFVAAMAAGIGVRHWQSTGSGRAGADN